MKQLRRLGVEIPSDPYERMQRGLFRCVKLSEDTFRWLMQERPELVSLNDGGALIAEPRRGSMRLHYSFENRDAFLREFRSALGTLLPAIQQEQAPLGITFTLLDRPSRGYVEQALKALAFEFSREWLRMELAELSDGPAPNDAVAPGMTLRPATPDDAEAIAALDEASFPMNLITPPVAREIMEVAPVLRVLEDTHSQQAVGFLHLELRGDEGHIATIAVHPEYRRRGLGEAMMRWALAYFPAEDRHRAALTVSMDNGPAIALYRKLGFTVGEVGIEYRRPIDEDEVQQVLDRNRGAHIRVRKRY